MTQPTSLLRTCAAFCFLSAGAAVASAQSTTTPANQGGPMVVEQVEHRAAIVPEYKVSKFDGSTAQLIGAHAGALVGTVLIGGGLYTLTNGARGQGLTYGGAVIGWQPWSASRVGLNLRTLIGMGSGTTSDEVSVTTRDGRQLLRATRRISTDMFVAEPQIDLLVRLTRHLHVGLGGGYRFTNASKADNDRFKGVSGSVTLRIGTGN